MGVDPSFERGIAVGDSSSNGVISGVDLRMVCGLNIVGVAPKMGCAKSRLGDFESGLYGTLSLKETKRVIVDGLANR